MKRRTFAEIFCELEGVAPTELRRVLFRRTLYPHARPVARLVDCFNDRYFTADREFIDDVCYLRSLQDFFSALESYVEHPANQGRLRRTFRIRVSARRMMKIVRQVFGPADSGTPAGSSARNTFEPFSGPARPDS